LLWEKTPDNYYTNGISQGAALWTNVNNTNPSTLTVTEYSAAPAIAATEDVRPHERGLLVDGTIDKRATGVVIQVINASGNAIQLRADRTSTVNITELNGTLSAESGDVKPFSAVVYFDNAAAAFGPVHVIVKSAGITKTVLGAFYVHLCGFKSALANDTLSNANGTQPGPVQTETDELIVIDFQASPQGSKPLLAAQTRARRMIRHQITNRDRQFIATDPFTAQKPEMPMWMVENQVIGLNQTQLQDLMLRRLKLISTLPDKFTFSWNLKITLSWDGPDSATNSPRLYRYSQDFTHALSVHIDIDNNGVLKNITNGRVTDAFDTPQNTITFPVTNRRQPAVVISGQQRPWLRVAGAAVYDTCIIEWQPAIVDGTDEIIRGGECLLVAEQISINGTRINRGKVMGTTPATVTDPPAAEPDYSQPLLRVTGVNPTGSQDPVIDFLVSDYYTNNSTVNRVTLLTVACWQETVRRIYHHESGGNQFDIRGTAMRRYAGQWYGNEGELPIFGPPHGYGMGQHDNPPVNNDGAWDYVANLRETVRRIMDDKAGAAYTLISAHLPTPSDQRIRAVYQREVVRRYNGGREFEWNGTAWHINPSVARWADNNDHSRGANPRLRYPNQVLGTNVVYSTGTGAATTFPWPITFTATDFGPQTA
jgi:hypothetical protein